jgi:hypothetical protein
MEDKACFPHLQRACRDGTDGRNCWTLEQLECLWAELDMLLAEVGDRRAQLHGERAALTVWMSMSMLKSPQLFQLTDEDGVGGARTRSAGMAGCGLEGFGLARQLSGALNSKGSRDRYGRFLKSELDANAEGLQKGEAHLANAGAGALNGSGGGGGGSANGGKGGAELDDEEWEGEAAGYEIRRASAEADPEAFWQFGEGYFEPVSQEAADTIFDMHARTRRFCGDEVDVDDPFEMLPRGRHYLEQWEEEAQLFTLVNNGGASPPPPAAPALRPAEGKLHWQLDAEDPQRYSSRVFNALVDQPGFIPCIDIAPTRAGALDSLSQPTPLEALTVSDSSDQAKLSAQLEEELRAELLRVGLLDGMETKLADEDDSLCAELRAVQLQLRAAVTANEAQCAAARSKIEQWLQQQREEESKQAEAEALVERWRAVMKRLKAERKAERRRKNFGNLKTANGRKVTYADAAAPTMAARAASVGGEAASQLAAEGPAPAPKGNGTGPGASPPPRDGDDGDDGLNDDSSDEEREEEPGPGWGMAAPDAVASAAPTPARLVAARKRTMRAKFSPSSE